MPIEIQAAIVTASDTRKLDDDLSGAALVELLRSEGVTVVEHVVVKDEVDAIGQTLQIFAERSDINLILTTGGTGLGPRDCTPEATRAVIEREVPGIPEAMRRETFSKTPMAMLSRSIAGILNNTLIINLPGSPKGVSECFEVIRPVLQHAVDQVSGETKHDR